MNAMNRSKGTGFFAIFAAASLLMLGTAGCSKEEPQYVEVQTIEEKPAEVHDHSDHTDHTGHNHGPEPSAAFDYSIPDGWTALTTRNMQLLTLQAGISESVPATVSVSAFPGDVGGKVANVNRWRRQTGLGPVSAEVAEGMIEPVTVAGMEGWKVDILGNGPEDSHATARLIVTAVSHNGQTWFFKIVGANSAVESQLVPYGEFVDSISF